jgi:cobalamin-dependent methionine synthase I
MRHRRSDLTRDALAAVEQPAIVPTASDFSTIKVDAPGRQLQTGVSNTPPSFRAVKRHYLHCMQDPMSYRASFV